MNHSHVTHYPIDGKHHVPDRSRAYLTLGIVAFLSSLIFLLVAYAVDSSGFLHAHTLAVDNFFNNYFTNHSFPIAIAIVMLAVTYLVSTPVLIAVFVVLFLVLVIVHRRYLSAFFLAGLAAGGIIDVLLKLIFERARPMEMVYAVSDPGYSFPSAHALLATVFYGFLGFCLAHALYRRSEKIIVGIVTAIIIFLIGISRVFLGVHWASDVIGGWTLGLVLLSLLIFIFYHAHDRIHTSPFSFPHGPSMVFILIILLLLGGFMWHFYSMNPLTLVQ